MQIKITLLVVLLFLMGCSDSNNNPTFSDPTFKPEISNLQYDPKTAAVNQGGGQVTINGSVDCTGLLCEIRSMTFIVNHGNPETFGVSGCDSWMGCSKIDIKMIVPTTTIGVYNFEVYATEKGGSNSNTLEGTFIIN